MENQARDDPFNLRPQLHIQLKVGCLAVGQEAVIVGAIVTDEDIPFGGGGLVAATAGEEEGATTTLGG